MRQSEHGIMVSRGGDQAAYLDVAIFGKCLFHPIYVLMYPLDVPVDITHFAIDPIQRGCRFFSISGTEKYGQARKRATALLKVVYGLNLLHCNFKGKVPGSGIRNNTGPSSCRYRDAFHRFFLIVKSRQFLTYGFAFHASARPCLIYFASFFQGVLINPYILSTVTMAKILCCFLAGRSNRSPAFTGNGEGTKPLSHYLFVRFSFQAAARFGVARGYPACLNPNFSPAITFTKPLNRSSGSRLVGYRRKLSKFLARNIFYWHITYPERQTSCI